MQVLRKLQFGMCTLPFKYAADRLGFTILEIVLSLSLIGILFAVSLPVAITYQTRNDLDTSVFIYAETLRRAQIYSESVQYAAPWGVYIENGSMTLFQGASYDTRDVAFDEVQVIPPSILVSGIQEIVFERLTGDPQSGSFPFVTDFSSQVSSAARSVSVNSKGVVDY